MVDNQAKTEAQQRLEQWVLNQGYPSMEAYQLEDELVKLGWALSDGDESVKDAYYHVLDEIIAMGWNPQLLDGQQEVMVGKDLYMEMVTKYKEHQTIIK